MLRWPTFWKFNFKVCKFDITLNAFLVVFISAFTYVIYICLDICWYKYNLITYFMFALFLCLNSILILPCTHVLSLSIDVVLIFFLWVYITSFFKDIRISAETKKDTPQTHCDTMTKLAPTYCFFNYPVIYKYWALLRNNNDNKVYSTLLSKKITRPFVNYQEWLQFTWYRAYICNYISWLKLAPVIPVETHTLKCLFLTFRNHMYTVLRRIGNMWICLYMEDVFQHW